MTESTDRLLGRIEEKLDRLTIEFAEFRQTRGKLYERLVELEHQLEEIRKDINSIEKRVMRVEHPIENMRIMKERFVGAKLLIFTVAALIGGTLAGYLHKVLDFLKSL